MTIPLPSNRDREAWQVAVWNADDAMLSRTQKTEFMHILEAGFNSFDPFRVIADLLGHRDLWEAALMTRGFPVSDPPDSPRCRLHGDLITLRDLPRGYWNVDTLYLLLERPNAAALRTLAGNWRADEMDLIEGEEVSYLLGSFGGPGDPAILRVWWD